MAEPTIRFLAAPHIEIVAFLGENDHRLGRQCGEKVGVIQAERSGHDPQTTNNRMELTALIEAFRLLPSDAAETVRTDSRLCVDTIESWAPKWERAGWKRKAGPIKNLELVQELLALRRARPGCQLQWIAAHSGHRWNEYADSLSTAWQRDEL